MTDLDLQDTLQKYLESYLDDAGRKLPWADDLKEVYVHTQELPLKDSAEEKDLDGDIGNQWNYICILLDEENLEDGVWKVQVHFSIGVKDTGKDCQGHRYAANLMNEIFLYFVQLGIIDGKYQIDSERAYKRFDLDTEYPYYHSDLITFWELPVPQMEGLEELI